MEIGRFRYRVLLYLNAMACHDPAEILGILILSFTWDLFARKIWKLLLFMSQAAADVPFINGGETVAAPVRAASAGFTINDVQLLKIPDILFIIKEGSPLIL